jgi:hypothetical protein
MRIIIFYCTLITASILYSIPTNAMLYSISEHQNQYQYQNQYQDEATLYFNGDSNENPAENDLETGRYIYSMPHENNRPVIHGLKRMMSQPKRSGNRTAQSEQLESIATIAQALETFLNTGSSWMNTSLENQNKIIAEHQRNNKLTEQRLNGEIETARDTQKRWIIGTSISALVSFAALGLSIYNKVS